MKKFEYKVVSTGISMFASGDKYVEQISATLNTLGTEGWELIETKVSFFMEGFFKVHIFKREID
jgi:hypothetical protein